MNGPTMFEPRRVAPDTDSITAYIPVPGFGVLPVNAFVIHAEEPVLVDTGLKALGREFMHTLRNLIDPTELRWIWLTHTDPDHLGNLEAILQEAPNARVITTYLGMGKMGMHQLPLNRVYLLNPGQRLTVGDRELLAVTPPTFDAPETTALFDGKTQTLYSADCFGALMEAPMESAAAINADALRSGCMGWAMVDAPWLHLVDQGKFVGSLDAIRNLKADTILSAHLPAATGMTDILLRHLGEAHQSPAFIGPDQHVLEQMIAGQNAA